MCLWEQACWPFTDPTSISSHPCSTVTTFTSLPSEISFNGARAATWLKLVRGLRHAMQTELKRWSWSFTCKKSGVFSETGIIPVLFAPIRSCCEWPNEVARNKGNNEMHQLSFQRQPRFLQHWHILKQPYRFYTSFQELFHPSRINTVSYLLPRRDRTNLRPVTCFFKCQSITWVWDWPWKKLKLQPQQSMSWEGSRRR